MNEIIALLAVSLCMAGIGYLLTRLAQTPDQKTNDSNTHGSEQRSSASDSALIERVNDKLPQTQCAQCGYPGCRPYAEAIVRDHAPINQCPPGGEALIDELADFLGTSAPPLDPQRGTHKPPQLAHIIEADCIGCTLCIAACPVDAIVGAQRYMHTVITDQCTGCELCLPPCPVDCIELYDKVQPLKQWYWSKPGTVSGTRLHIPDTVPDTEPQH